MRTLLLLTLLLTGAGEIPALAQDTLYYNLYWHPTRADSAAYYRIKVKTARYPDSAVVYEIQGTVIVDFVISKEGKAGSFRVSSSVNKYLDAEALRVIEMMPDWIPAIAGGLEIESFKRQPIIFSLQSN